MKHFGQDILTRHSDVLAEIVLKKNLHKKNHYYFLFFYVHKKIKIKIKKEAASKRKRAGTLNKFLFYSALYGAHVYYETNLCNTF